MVAAQNAHFIKGVTEMENGTKKNIAKISVYMLFAIVVVLFPLNFTACSELEETPFEQRVKAIIILCGTISIFVGFVVFCALFAYSELVKEKGKGDRK